MIRTAAVNLAVFAGLVAAAELGAALFVDRAWDHFTTAYRLNHTWKPNSKRTHAEFAAANPEYPKPYVHRYNAQGWIEDYDVAKAKPAGVHRIFYLGDSFTEGTAPMEASVPSLIEKRLGPGVEVINTGTSSYSPSIFYVLARYVLLDYAPDLLVVNVDMTDVDDDWRYASTLIADENGDPWAVPPLNLAAAPLLRTERGFERPTLSLRLQLWLLKHSHLYNLLRRDVTRRPWGAAPDWATLAKPAFGWCREPWDEGVRADVERTFGLLRRLAKLCRERGVKLALTGVPHHEQFTGEWSARPHRELARLARELGVPYLDSHAALKPVIVGAPREKFYYRGDMHFNPRGYAVWADAQARFLLDRRHGLLPEAFYR